MLYDYLFENTMYLNHRITNHRKQTCSTYVAIWMKFDEELFPFKTKFPNNGPREGVDFGM